MSKIAWIGLGVMGFPMAGHIRTKGGYDLTVYNRTAAKADEWVAKFGGRTAATPRSRARRERATRAASAFRASRAGRARLSRARFRTA